MRQISKSSTAEDVARQLLPHLSFAVEPGVVLQQEVGHLSVAIVTGHVERSVAHLQRGRDEHTGSGVGENRTSSKKTRNIVTGASCKVNYSSKDTTNEFTVRDVTISKFFIMVIVTKIS